MEQHVDMWHWCQISAILPAIMENRLLKRTRGGPCSLRAGMKMCWSDIFYRPRRSDSRTSLLSVQLGYFFSVLKMELKVSAEIMEELL